MRPQLLDPVAEVARTWRKLATVGVDGEPAFLLAEDVGDLAGTAPTQTVRLLPGFDQYVLGPRGVEANGPTPTAGERYVDHGWVPTHQDFPEEYLNGPPRDARTGERREDAGAPLTDDDRLLQRARDRERWVSAISVPPPRPE